MKFYPSIESSLSLSSCSGEPIIVDFIKIDNGLLTLQLSLNAKQRLRGKRTGDESVHGDKGSVNQKERFLKYRFYKFTFHDFKMVTHRRKCTQMRVCP